ncbi:16S rRNA (cytosine(1402)-N(4))-methyltransferase RsmH [Alkalibacter mobilis]|uniref:16S rRNA (cytosine(1402)-N(4))-methyltransferase RsmH n=1 Tax=Alkalibacter mobilis TaxID=2787712 RepID=UPI00189F92F8|nr:16S rRNA (cytosine(1402)-N(4))-methyltransferase RsmH [Alkalibacter mobilis]MBF7097122.1 16S rRNA (cytosine(1402)-N(4))-methyltransferase RsmH [Alkalibacter mobilis]
MDFVHESVLLNECIENLDIKPDGVYVDGTLGGAGHSYEICSRLNGSGTLIGIDQDEYALKKAEDRLKGCKCNVILVRDNFKNMKNVIYELGFEKVDGILLDLGVSSFQLDDGSRGFSYMLDADLDMRMDNRSGLSAFEVVNEYTEQDLFKIIKIYGEEKFAKRIANFIVKERSVAPIKTTQHLAEVIKSAIPAKFRREGPHPAKRTFQAIRIEVNDELGVLEKALTDGVECLGKKGRIAIITFHSLEDRIVKQRFKELQDPCTCPPDFPVCQCGREPIVKIITKKPIYPNENEINFNPRARSAKLRVAEKI